jgi:hypothetical protein
MTLVWEGERRETQATSAAVAVVAKEDAQKGRRKEGKRGSSYLLILLKAQVKALKLIAECIFQKQKDRCCKSDSFDVFQNHWNISGQRAHPSNLLAVAWGQRLLTPDRTGFARHATRSRLEKHLLQLNPPTNARKLFPP